MKANALRFSPKIFFVILSAAAVIVLSGLFLFRSVFTGNVLTSVTHGDFRFDLCGNETLSQIVVYEDGKKTALVKTTSAGGKNNGYGVKITDIDQNGFPDILVCTEIKKEDAYYSAWTWNDATGTFRHAESFIHMPNVTENTDYRALISHAEESRYAGEDSHGEYYENAEVYRIFRIIDGELLEFARYELVYYTKNDIYAYRVFRYSAERGALSTFSEDKWMDPQKAEGFSLKDSMDADMLAHTDDYSDAK